MGCNGHSKLDWDHRLSPSGTQQQPESSVGLHGFSACKCSRNPPAAYQSVPDVLSLVIDTRAPEVAPMS